MKFTTAATILTLSIFGTTDGATPCADLPRGIPTKHGGSGVCGAGLGPGASKFDAAFIHRFCKSPHKPLCYDTSVPIFGPGWYCNDGANVKDMICDDAVIPAGCTDESGLTYDHGADHWVCKHPFAKSTDDQDEDAAVHDADVAAALVTSSSSTDITTKGDPSVVLVVVGLLGATMMALKVALQRRHRGILRRHHYSAVDATPIEA